MAAYSSFQILTTRTIIIKSSSVVVCCCCVFSRYSNYIQLQIIMGGYDNECNQFAKTLGNYNNPLCVIINIFAIKECCCCAEKLVI